MKRWTSVCIALFLAMTTPAQAVPLAAFDDEFLPPYTEASRPGTVTVTFLGTTTLLFDDGVTQILVDAFITRPPLGIVMSKPLQTDPETVDKILWGAHADHVRAIFVTHSHYDHALDVAYLVRKTDATLYGSPSTLNLARGKTLSDERLQRSGLDVPLADEKLKPLVTGQVVEVGDFRIEPVPARHSPPIPLINDDLGTTIDEPPAHPLSRSGYVEGGTYGLYITHGAQRMLVIAAANYEPGALHERRAEYVFLSIGGIGRSGAEFHARYYDNTVGCAQPSLVVPVHWDKFTVPLSDTLPVMPFANTTLRYMRERLRADGIRMGVMQGMQRVKLFDENTPAPKRRDAAPGCLASG